MQSTGVLETAKATNPLKALLEYGQSMWLDYIRRDLITSGELKSMIDEDGLRGMTSNPSIFEKAIADSRLYEDMLEVAGVAALIWTRRHGMNRSPSAIFRMPLIFSSPVYESSKFRDGYVSLEVSPYSRSRRRRRSTKRGGCGKQ